MGLQPLHQAAAIVARLQGTGRELTRTLTPTELLQGGAINGVALDPVGYLMHHLRQRFAQLDDEGRLDARTITCLSTARWREYKFITEPLRDCRAQGRCGRKLHDGRRGWRMANNESMRSQPLAIHTILAAVSRPVAKHTPRTANFNVPLPEGGPYVGTLS